MIFYIYEINRILSAIVDLHTDNGSNTHNVISYLNNISINARSSNPIYDIKICKRIGIIYEYKNHLFLTEYGKKFYSLNNIENGSLNIDLNKIQKNFLVDCIFNSKFYINILKKFSNNLRFDYVHHLWFNDKFIIKEILNDELYSILSQTSFMNHTSNITKINKNYSYHISKSRNNITRSQEKLLKIINKQNEIGKIAELVTMKYESNRLKKYGYADLSLSIQRISQENIFAGYDIMSYDGKRSTLDHDRFIEVKGTSGNEPRFYWSVNEIDTAQKLQDKYWIYLWIKIATSVKPILYKKIQNPYKNIFQNMRQNIKPVLYTVKL